MKRYALFSASLAALLLAATPAFGQRSYYGSSYGRGYSSRGYSSRGYGGGRGYGGYGRGYSRGYLGGGLGRGYSSGYTDVPQYLLENIKLLVSNSSNYADAIIRFNEHVAAAS